jgi:hypothetical protein
MTYKFNPFTGNFDITSSPGGSTTNIQFNDGGSFGGASQLTYDKTQSFTGVQQSSPLAPLHVTGAIGTQIPAPTTFTATLVEDVPVTSPTSGSVSAIYGPTTPGAPTVSLIQIDYISNSTPNQNTSSGGNYTCNGQTIDYRIYAYKLIDGIRVCTPSYYSTSFTDTINDGSTQFKVDLTGFTAPYSNLDGVLVSKSFDGGYTWPYSVDAGYTSSYTDDNFTSEDAFEVSQYTESGGNWDAYVSQYQLINGTYYTSNYDTNYATDSNTGQALVISVTLATPTTANGFMIQQYNGLYRAIGTNTSYFDWGSSVGIVPQFSFFDSIAFPIMNTSLTGSSSTTASFNYGAGSYTATGSSWSISIWEYRIHPETGEKWFVSTPDTYSLGTDNGSSSSFDIFWSTSIGDGQGRVVVVTQDGNDIYEEDVGANSNGNISGFNTVTSKPNISSFTGIYRSFGLYGKVVSPAVKYSNSGYTYNISCPNSAPYILLHSLPSGGNATNFKIVETSYRIGSVYDAAVVSNFYQFLTGIGSSNVSPSVLGFLSNGTNLNRTYAAYSSKNAYGVTAYSATPITVTTTDPSNSKYYVVVLAWASVAGASYKLKRTIGASVVYHIEGNTTYTDTIVAAWADSSTIAPTSIPVTGAIVERSCTSTSNPGTLTIRNTYPSLLNYAVFDYVVSGGGSTSEVGRFGIDGSAQFFVQSNTGNLLIKTPTGTPAIVGAQTFLNYENSYSGVLGFKGGSGGWVSLFSASYDTAFFGNNGTWSYADPQSSVCIAPKDGSDIALLISQNPTAPDQTGAIQITNSSLITRWLVTNDGRTAIGTSSTGNGILRIAGGDNNKASIQLADSSSVPNVIGGILRYGNNFFGGDSFGTMRKFLFSPLIFTTNSFAYLDSTGALVADNKLYWNGSYLGAIPTMLFNAGLSISANQSISMGTGASISGGIIFSYAAKSANYTLFPADYCINVTASGKTITLPTAVSKTGQIYVIKATHTSGTTTLNTTSSQTIFTTSAVTSITMNAGDTVRVMSNGTNWIAI